MIPLVAVLVTARVCCRERAPGLVRRERDRAPSRGRERGAREGARAARPSRRSERIVASVPEADWERDLVEALSAAPDVRAALVNEQLTELDYRIQRWARVPRVCASIATSFGFMLATLVLRDGLADTGDVPIEVGELVLRGLVGDALTVGAMGIVGTAFCIGAQSEARRIARARIAGADKLVERLEGLL